MIISKIINTNTASETSAKIVIPLEAEVMLRPLLYKIHNEDCRETLAKLPNECIDLVVTSPPYDDLRTYKGHKWNFEIFTEIAKELFRVMKAGGVLVWVVSDATRNGSETGTSFRQALRFMDIGFNLHDTMIYEKENYLHLTHNRYEQCFEYTFIISKGKPKTFNPIMVECKRAGENINWDKENAAGYEKKGRSRHRSERTETRNEKIKKNIWSYGTGLYGSTSDKEAFQHPAIFPEGLAEDHIKSWSNENDIIYDPFSGSGTTCKIADRLGRAWFGSEIAEEYCSVALRRVSNDLFTKAST